MPAKSTSTATRRTARTPPAPATRGARSPAATARRRKPAARSRPRTSPNDAIALLKGDHRRVAAMFLQFDRMKADGSRKEALVAKICQELTVHARVEEEIFYPAARISRSRTFRASSRGAGATRGPGMPPHASR